MTGTCRIRHFRLRDFCVLFKRFTTKPEETFQFTWPTGSEFVLLSIDGQVHEVLPHWLEVFDECKGEWTVLQINPQIPCVQFDFDFMEPLNPVNLM